jgi:PIN domain nuclease of toxin-antitoxin system
VILLDTHVLVWLALEPQKLSADAKAAILNARRNSLLAIAGISLWEIAWLVENKRIETALSVESFVRDCASKVRVIPETPEIAARAVTFPTSYPRDPQDRLIGATAIVEGIPLVTHDKLIRKSRLISTIW